MNGYDKYMITVRLVYEDKCDKMHSKCQWGMRGSTDA